jgi:hypothetical protein
MRKLFFIGLACFLISCGETAPSEVESYTPIQLNEFNKQFKGAELPIIISDTNLTKFKDEGIIEYKTLGKFIPDSVLKSIVKGKEGNTSIYPLVKIDKPTEYYLLLKVKQQAQVEIAVLVFNHQNKYLDYKMITSFKEGSSKWAFHPKTLYINKEPSFLVIEHKKNKDNNVFYEKTGWAYSEGSFKLIFNDQNTKPTNRAIINPIDTLPKNNAFSGNYVQDDRNFISLRDYGNPNKYQFFLHVDKNDGGCTGELKGIINFKKNTATFTEKGDPCTIHFAIEGSTISIKEDGNCGSHRGMKCYFDDKFDLKKREKKKK